MTSRSTSGVPNAARAVSPVVPSPAPAAASPGAVDAAHLAQQLAAPDGLPLRRSESARTHADRLRTASAHIAQARQAADAQPPLAQGSRRFPSAHHVPLRESAGTSPLLPSESLGRSDCFSIDLGREIDPVDSAEFVIDMADAAAVPTPREQLEQALARYEFAAPPGPEREAQQALQARYVAWASGVAGQRQAVFGAGYAVGGGQLTTFGEAVVPALYDGARQFMSSSARSPFQNATLTVLAPRYTDAGGQRVNLGEMDNHYDAGVVAGAVGGATAYAVDATLLTAMDRRAKAANLPQLKAVDLKALVPDPCPVQLQLEGGLKTYWQPAAAPGGDIETGDAAVAGRPSLAELKDGADLRRRTLQAAQDGLDANGWGALAQPLLTGALNTLRRVLMPVKALQQVLPVFGGSVLASGAAGGIAKLGLGLAKPLATAQVDDLVGGTQRASLFATRLPDPSQAPARLSDIGGLPRHAAAAARDTVALAGQFVAGPWRGTAGASRTSDAVRARVDDCARVVAANTLASVFANGAGPFAARLLRGDAAGAIAGESPKSSAYLLQQATTSFSSDLAWQSLKKGFKGGTLDLAGPLDRWQARRAASTQPASTASPRPPEA